MSKFLPSSKPALHLAQHLHSPVTAWIILVFGLIFTGMAWYLSSKYVANSAVQRFSNRVDEITAAIYARMIVYEQVLWGGVGFLAASGGNVNRTMWRDYVSALKLSEQWPGIQDIGYSVPVAPQMKQQHIEHIRNEGFPAYTITPEGERDTYTAIIFLEPFDWRNQRAFGYDMWSNNVRREAMMRARDSGVAATSGIITLVQETGEDIQNGFKTYVPFYKPGLPVDTEEQRRSAFQGWVYAAFRVEDLMRGILGDKTNNVQYSIYDGTDIIPDRLLFDSNSRSTVSSESNSLEIAAISKSLLLQGRQWTLVFNSSDSSLSAGEANLPNYIAVGGLVIDLLLFYVVTSLAFLHKRAESMARQINVELHEAKARLDQKYAESEKLVGQLSDSNEELSLFAYSASHDLQEPLRMVINFTQLIKRRFNDKLDAQGKEYIRFAVDGASRMKILIEDLLEYARLQQQSERFSHVDCALELQHVLNDLEESIHQCNAKITYDELPHIQYNAVRFTRVLRNLVSNALTYRNTADQLHIHIGVTEVEDYWRFYVKDNGIGINKDYFQKIFLPFKQLHAKGQFGGTGMGLAICRKIVESHGGKIWVESELEQGSTFYFSIPKYQQHNVITLEKRA